MSWVSSMQAILTKLKEQDPVLAASVSKLELMVSPFAALNKGAQQCAQVADCRAEIRLHIVPVQDW